jgi:hypothetical protein
MGGQRFRDEGCIISAPWATIFRGHPSEDVMTSHPSLKRMADKSGLAGIVQEHTEATVCAGHGSPRPLQ